MIGRFTFRPVCFYLLVLRDLVVLAKRKQRSVYANIKRAWRWTDSSEILRGCSSCIIQGPFTSLLSHEKRLGTFFFHFSFPLSFFFFIIRLLWFFFSFSTVWILGASRRNKDVRHRLKRRVWFIVKCVLHRLFSSINERGGEEEGERAIKIFYSKHFTNLSILILIF